MVQSIILQMHDCYPGISSTYRNLQREIQSIVSKELSSFEFPAARLPQQLDKSMRARRTWFSKLMHPEKTFASENEWDRDERILRDWTTRAHSSEDAVHRAALSSLTKVATAVRLRHGKILGRHTFLGLLATDLACNEYGGILIGSFLEPKICTIARKEGFRQLPAQTYPVAMVTKGASASGKSTMRPLQRVLAKKMGVHWRDFALISPDTWRRVFLDFDSLGTLYKYAGMLTSQEVTIVDQKLDAHLVRKGEMRETSHLLVDRFRFDSFALDSDENKHLASRFVGILCYFFMITPPELTVERAWKRGLEVGRYKAVDDILAHNVEACTGMQNILFGRALDPKIRIHYEFLDNDVPLGEVPLTVAFGWSGEMVIFDIKRMIDMERYRKININAQRPDEVYPGRTSMTAGEQLRILGALCAEIPAPKFC